MSRPCEHCKDGAPRGIGKGRESRTEMVGRHLEFTTRLISCLVKYNLDRSPSRVVPLFFPLTPELADRLLFLDYLHVLIWNRCLFFRQEQGCSVCLCPLQREILLSMIDFGLPSRNGPEPDPERAGEERGVAARRRVACSRLREHAETRRGPADMLTKT